MGVLNITPDSFSGDGLLSDQQQAMERGLAMLEAGSEILDIGGRSDLDRHLQVADGDCGG